MQAEPSAEARIIEQLRAREPSGLAAAYDLYARTAFSLIVRITRDKVVSEDLLQELFLRVWNHGRDFDANKGTLGVWILSIARNIAIDHMRSAQKRFSKRLHATPHLDELCFSNDPSGAESRIGNVEAIREGLDALSAEEKRVVELAYFDGFSQTEIAERLHQPLGTVKSRMRAALQRLRALLKGSQP